MNASNWLKYCVSESQSYEFTYQHFSLLITCYKIQILPIVQYDLGKFRLINNIHTHRSFQFHWYKYCSCQSSFQLWECCNNCHWWSCSGRCLYSHRSKITFTCFIKTDTNALPLTYSVDVLHIFCMQAIILCWEIKSLQYSCICSSMCNCPCYPNFN